MSIENAVSRRAGLLTQVGKSALNIMYPNEFELYLIALELVWFNGNKDNALGSTTLSYFIFPVMPSSFDETKNKLTNIKKTLGGVSVLSSSGFNPTDISISGSFGRKFRVLLQTDYQDLISGFQTNGKTTLSSILSGGVNVFDSMTKTGYGCCKVLESIYDAAGEQILDSSTGVSNTALILHNLALGNSYFVKPLNLRFSQSQDSNMIWNYNLNLKSIAPLDSIYDNKDLQNQRQRLVISGYVQDRVDQTVNKITSLLS